jgi:pyruvate dehydrogenase E2 component (dihydrolipoamide acetyltransferase)
MTAPNIHQLTMPKWGLSMKEGAVVAWLAGEGTEVGPGAEVVEIETDKIASGLEPHAAGVLRRQVARVGEIVPVGGLLGVIADAEVPETEIDGFIAAFRSSFRPEEVAEEEAGPVSRMADVRGRSLRFLQRGEGGEPAILIHGFGGDLNNWLFNHEALAAGRAVYALELPGHGSSSKNVGGGTVDEFVLAVEGFMDALGLQKAHLVGHSMGGSVALRFAQLHTSRVASLVLISSAGLGPEIDAAYIGGFVTAGKRKELKPLLDKLFANPALVSRRLADDILKYKRLDGVQAALRTIADQFCPGGRQAVVLRDELARLSIPLLVIWGQEDRILPASHASGLPENVRTEIIPASGHMVQMEAAARVNRLVTEFWEQP